MDSAAPHFAALAEAVVGEVITPADATYDEARAIWNGTIDRRPAVIVRCTGTADVVAALEFAQQESLPVAVRGGGHSVSGLSTVDDGLVIDLSPMKAVEVDVENRRAFAQPGLLGSELDHATQAKGLGTTLGTVSHTGIAGLTLGGGMGWLMRRHGLACDNVRSFEVVLADGRVTRVADDSEPDLFWALRGGGGQFAVVTQFEYELHEFGPEVALTQVAFDPADALPALRAARDLARGTARDRDLWIGFMELPHDPELDEVLRGRPVFVVMGVSIAPEDADGGWLGPLFDHGPLFGHTERCPYVVLQSMFDESNAHGVLAYSKGAFVADLSDEALEVFARQAAGVPHGSGDTLVYLQQMGGRVAEIPEADSAVPARSADYVLNVIARWADPQHADDMREWARGLIAALAPHTLGPSPVNFDGDTVRDARRVVDSGFYGGIAERLRGVKEKYDPNNVFGSLRLPL